MTPKTRVHDWVKITLTESDSFSAALELMSRGGYQLALVRRSDGRLAGMVTDSDIRKALLRGTGLEQPVTVVMNATPLVVSPDLAENEAHKLMVLNHFFHLPVVDPDGQLVGLHVAEQLCTADERSEAFVIMAGGRGKRLMPLTATIPKPMLPLKGRPILQHIIERAKVEGFRQIVLTVNYLAENITNYFGDGSAYDVDIQYVHEQQPLGTAGSLSALPSKLRSEYMVVTNADVITDVPYGDLLRQVYRDTADGIMAVRLHEWQNPFGVVRSESNHFLGLDEKPLIRYQVNAGIYSIGPALLSLLEAETYCDMPDLFERGLNEGLDLRIFPMHETWLDIGRPADYELACKLYSRNSN